jgi:hypothetical protein
MAQKVVVSLVDDLDGTSSDDISTITFGLDGANYEIDLTGRNAGHLRDKLADFVGAARRTGGRVKDAANTSTGPATRPAADREQTRAIRDWAKRTGRAVSDRGRIPADIVSAFEDAHATPAAAKRTGRKK